MSVLVLSDVDVGELLDMESCVAAMEDALAALARDELSMPLRSVFRPSTDQLMGLMPAHRGGRAPVFSLKEIVVAPANAARGLDPHQGAVLLHDGETGVLRAILNASAITEIRTAAVSAVATKLLARSGARQVAILGSGVQAGSHARAMRAVLRDPELRVWSRTPAHAEALALESHASVCATVEEALDGADIVCTCTASPSCVAPGWHRGRTSTPSGRPCRPPGSSRPTSSRQHRSSSTGGSRPSTSPATISAPSRRRASGRTTSSPSSASSSSALTRAAATTRR